jgi:hypothetical protein
MTEVRGSLTPLSYHVEFHLVPLDAYVVRLTRHFIVRGNISVLNPLEFNVVILPLITLMAGLSARRRGSNKSGVAA